MNEVDKVDTETAELFGGEVTPIQPDQDELEVQIALRTIRDHLMATAERDKVGVNQLARRLSISPSAVSRFLGGDGDVRLSTAVLYARALGCRWDLHLRHDDACTARGNHLGHAEFIGRSASTSTSGTTTTVHPRGPQTILAADPHPRLAMRAIA